MSVFERNEPNTTGQPGPDRLDERDAGERLADLLRERGDDGDRRHRAHEQERRHDRRLARLRVLDERREHAVVVAERRVDVDQRDDRGRLVERLLAEHDLGHRDRVARVRAGGHGAHERLVGERHQRVDHVEVTRVERLVVGLADRSARRVELRERLREPHEVLEVVVGRVPPLVPLAHERAAVDRGEDHVLAADLHAPLGVPGLERELRRAPSRPARGSSPGRTSRARLRPSGPPARSTRAPPDRGTRCRAR